MNLDYEQLISITVKSQDELEMIPEDFKGKIYIEFGSYFNPAIINKAYVRSVVARGNSSVEARGNSSVEARGNSSVVAWGNSSVVAWGNSSVVAWGNSSVVAWGNSSVVARGNSSVVAWENSSVEARGNSSVEARENSSVVARENSSVEANGNSQVVNCQTCDGRIKIYGNARIVFMPKNIEEYMAFYGIKHDKKKAIFYKAVHSTKEGYVSDYDSRVKYVVGESISIDCDPDIYEECSYGIHIAHLNWCLDFGRSWENLAIIEVEVDIEKIVLPLASIGKVRTSKIKVLREVPLTECGVYGKILANRIKNSKKENE